MGVVGVECRAHLVAVDNRLYFWKRRADEWEACSHILEDLIEKRIVKVFTQLRKRPNAGIRAARRIDNLAGPDWWQQMQPVFHACFAGDVAIAISKQVEGWSTNREHHMRHMSKALYDGFQQARRAGPPGPEQEKLVGPDGQSFAKRLSCICFATQRRNVADHM